MAERTERGQFAPGHTGNPAGRPKRERAVRFLDILRGAVTEEQFAKIVNKAVEQAVGGDAVARRWLTDYLIGPAAEQVDMTVTSKVLIWDLPATAAKKKGSRLADS